MTGTRGANGRGGGRGRGDGGRGGRGGRGGGRGGGGRGGVGSSGGGAPFVPRPAAPLESIMVPFTKMTPTQLDKAKNSLLNTVSASLIKEPRLEGSNSIIHVITVLVKKIAFYDPEFILKLALYTRDDLGIRTTANYLLSLASNIPASQPYVKRYFNATVLLPSDWLDVAATFRILPDKRLQHDPSQSSSSSSAHGEIVPRDATGIPTCLRKAMVNKFPSFDLYQLGKYNKEGSLKRKKKKLMKEIEAHPEKKEELLAAQPLKPALTIKQMIRQLHIAKPTYNVMCILGKKYPANESEYRRLGLTGEYDSSRAGKRMKLPVPETWETLLSAKGNKASTWEELIEHKKLPFMAMLRNLRNLIYTGVHPRYHRWVMNKLTNAETIANSRQFPFRFFSAYEVIPTDLADFNAKIIEINTPKKEVKGKPGQPEPADQQKKRKTAKKIVTTYTPPADLFAQYRAALDTAVQLATTNNVKPIRGSTVVFVNASASMQGDCPSAKGLGKFSKTHELAELLGLMCKYVCEECEFRLFVGDRHRSVGLIPGTILDNMAVVDAVAKSLAAVAGDVAGGEDGHAASAPFPFDYVEEAILTRKKIDNFIILSHQVVNTGDRSTGVANLLAQYRDEVNANLLFVSVDISGKGGSVSDGSADDGSSASSSSDTRPHPNDIAISGFSDSILRFIAERGDSNQLQHVEHIDIAKKLPKIKIANRPAYLDELESEAGEAYVEDEADRILAQEKARDTAKSSSSKSKKGKSKEAKETRETSESEGERAVTWRTARVFISSTFLDMHGERDLLTRHVIPEVRERCKQRQIHLYEVDLRWGVTEEESTKGSSVEICLDELDKCRPLFIGLLGRRYGWVPKNYTLSDEPRFDWVRSYTPGRSVTELEMYHGCLRDPKNNENALFYLRDSAFNKLVPQEHKKSFDSESNESAIRVDDLRDRIRSGVPNAYRIYQAKWGGVVDGKPMSTGLDDLHTHMVEDLWRAICRVFPEHAPLSDPLISERILHETFLESRVRQFVGRKELLDNLTRFCDGASGLHSRLTDNGTGMALVVGAPGSGKSATLSAFVKHYLAVQSKKRGVTKNLLVIYHSVGASSSSLSVRKLLHRICSEIAKRFPTTIKDEVPEEHAELIAALPIFLKEAAFQCRVVLVLDGIDQLDPANRAHSLDWLPHSVPVKIILSTTNAHVTHNVLRRRKPCPPEVVLGPLDIKDRREIVRKTLAEYRKHLDERPMNDQMRLLLKKTDANHPLYLMLACEELRVFGVYEQLGERIKTLAATVPRILDEVLTRIETDHGRLLVSVALGCLGAARGGLYETEMVVILRRGIAARDSYLSSATTTATSTSLSIATKSTLDTATSTSTSSTSSNPNPPNPHDRLPPAVWTRLYRSLSPFLRPISDAAAGESSLDFFHNQMQVAVSKRYLEGGDAAVRMHRLLAEYFHKQADPTRDRSWKGQARAISELPYHLIRAKMFKEAEAILTDLTFIERKCSLGMTFDLIGDYNEMTQNTNARSFIGSGLTPESLNRVKEFGKFVMECSHILSRQPSLTFQEASNQPDNSAPAQLASTLWQNKTELRSWLEWKNKRQGSSPCRMTINSFGTNVAVLASTTSPDGKYIAAASEDCSIKIFDAVTGAEVSTLIGHSNWVVSLNFSPDSTTLASASWDNSCRLWDVVLGSELALLAGHSRAVNCIRFSPDGKSLCSAGWDCDLRVWDALEGKSIRVLKGHTKPVNHCSYSKDGKFVASASWDGTIKIWNVLSYDASKLGNQRRGPNNANNNQKGKGKGKDAGPVEEVSLMNQVDTEVLVATLNSANEVGGDGGGGGGASIRACEFSPNGKQVVSVLMDGQVLVWDVVAAKLVARLGRHAKTATTCAYSPDGRFLISASEDCTMKIWAAVLGKELAQTSVASGTWLNCVAFSGDNSRLAAGSSDCSIKIFDSATLDVIATMTAHVRALSALAFSPVDNNILASASEDGTVRIWNISEKACMHVLSDHRDSVGCVVFSPDGTRLASASDDFSVIVWNVKRGVAEMTLGGHSSIVRTVAWSPNNKLIATAGRDGGIRLYTCNTGNYVGTLSGHKDWVNNVNFSHDSKRLVSCSWDYNLKVWDVRKAVELTTLRGHGSSVESAVFTSDDQRIVSAAYDNTLKVWDATAGTEITTLRGHDKRVNGLAVSSRVSGGDQTQSTLFNGQSVVCSVSDDGTLRMWDPMAGSDLGTLIGHAKGVLSCAFGASSNTVVSASEDSTVKLWDADLAINNSSSSAAASESDSPFSSSSSSSKDKDAKHVAGHTMWINSCSFSYDGTMLATASDDTTVKLWDPNTNLCTRTLATRSVVRCVSFSPVANHLLAACDDGHLYLWDLTASSSSATSASTSAYTYSPTSYKCHDKSARCVTWSSNGRIAFSGGWDCNLVQSDPFSRSVQKTWAKGSLHEGWVEAVAASATGEHIVSASREGRVVVLEKSRDSYSVRFTIGEGHSGYVSCVTFSPDGKLIVTGSRDHTLRIWDVSSGRLLKVLVGHTGPVTSCTFNANGSRVLSSGMDGVMYLWDFVTTNPKRSINGEFVHSAPCTSLSFSGKARMLATTDSIGNVYFIRYHRKQN
eukprot:TRINITY_DN2169_c0_g1_i12.p1 TRINITY_DN2169_c0_g1~~TRINITY_DN2169_c0_g1_i12.p1  ORF type:complete len:2586 (+),score=522.10 TRINITY_DN2169_c0_g1_i12:146-7903(+)